MFATICRMWCADSVTICGIAVAGFHRQMEDDTRLLGMKRFNSQSTTEYSKENDREWSFTLHTILLRSLLRNLWFAKDRVTNNTAIFYGFFSLDPDPGAEQNRMTPRISGRRKVSWEESISDPAGELGQPVGRMKQHDCGRWNHAKVASLFPVYLGS
jgi:hypothetical protein